LSGSDLFRHIGINYNYLWRCGFHEQAPGVVFSVGEPAFQLTFSIGREL